MFGFHNDAAAAAIGIKPQTLRKWRHLGRGPRHCKIGRRIVYRPEDLEDFLAHRVQRGEDD